MLVVILLLAGSAGATTLTVDDSGGADYKKIQDAINAASDGDTVLVYSGTYYENVNVNKQLVLRGIDKGGGKPMVDAGGRGRAITLSAGWSTIEGFTVTNSDMLGLNTEVGIKAVSNNNIIKNNEVSNSRHGIDLEFSSYNMLNGNTALNNKYNGIQLRNSSYNTLSDNTVSKNKVHGIRLYNSSNNTLRNNTALENEKQGIFLKDSSNNNTLIKNTASNNQDGFGVENFSNNNKLSGNTASNNKDWGIWVDFSKYNIVYHNNIINNQVSSHDGNFWDGNYWSDYKGIDANNDGIGDTPYIKNTWLTDNYPLMAPVVGKTWDIDEGLTDTYIASSSPTPIVPPVTSISSVKAQEANYQLLWSYVTGESASGAIRFGDISVSSDGSYIAAASDDRKIYFFNRNGELLRSYTIDKALFASSKDNSFIDFSASSDGSYVAAMFTQPNKVSFFNKEGKLLWSNEIGGSTGDVSAGSVSVSSDGSYIAVGSLDNNVYFFNKEGNLLWSYKNIYDSIRQYAYDVQDVSVSSDGSYIAVGTYGVYLLNREGKLLWSYKTNDWIKEVLVSSDGSYIAARSDQKVYFFNREGVLLWSYVMDDFISSLSASSDGSYIAAVTSGHHTTDKWVENGIVYFFSKEGKLLWSYGTNKSVDSISVSSDGSYIAAGSDRVYLFNREGKLLWNSRKVDGGFRVSLSSDGSSIASWSWRRNIYFFGLNASTIDGIYPEPVIVDVDGNVNLNKESLSFGDTLNIKAKIKLIGSEKIYGAPVLNIYGPVGRQGPYESITAWQLTRANQVIKGFHNAEFRWILPGDEFNFDVNWLWDDTGISPGTYTAQVEIWYASDNETAWATVARDSQIQLKGAYSWIPIPTSVSQGMSSYSAIITVLAIFLIGLAIVYFKTANTIKKCSSCGKVVPSKFLGNYPKFHYCDYCGTKLKRF